MAKYIIDIDNENAIVDGHLSIPLDLSIRGSEEETVKLNLIVGNNLTPYEEPDIDAIRKEAYEDGYKNAILSESKTENESISIGDEVKAPHGTTGYVCEIMDSRLIGIITNSESGKFYTFDWDIKACHKTGRHSDEIANIIFEKCK